MASHSIAGIEAYQPESVGASSKQSRRGKYSRRTMSRAARVTCYVFLALGGAFISWLYGASGGSSFVLAAPLVLLMLATFAALPDFRYPPVEPLRRLLTLLLFFYLCWPDYIALVIGDLPWISATRLFGIPLMIVLMICAFGSSRFRQQIVDISRGDRVTTWLFVAFSVYAFASVFFSVNPGASADKFAVFIYAGVVPFFVAMFLFNTPGRVRTFAFFMCVIAAYNIIIGVMEFRHSQLPWANDIPEFLKIEDEQISLRLAGNYRAADLIYRVSSRFSGPIGLGEFLGLATPFALHLLFTEKSRVIKASMLILLPAIAFMVLKTGSRLALISLLSSVMLYVLYQAIMRWRRDRNDIFAPAIMLMYPVGMAGFVALAFVWHRLHTMIFGGGAAQFSTQARHDQWVQGIPHVLSRPWGHGLGMSAGVLNYIGVGSDFPTIDSYYLSVLLDFGIVGFAVFYGMFVWTAGRSAIAALSTGNSETSFLAAVAVALVNFVIGKSVYSQTENHMLAFMLLGIAIALLRRHAAEKGTLPPSPEESRLIRPYANDYMMDWERRPEMVR